MSNLNSAPCGECNERYPACWGSCERYIAWRTERDKMVQARFEENQQRNRLAAVKMNGIRAMKRGKPKER